MSGMARAYQRVAGSEDGRNERLVLPICIHGDAAFPGEGVVPETFNLSRLRGYRVGGTLHIIVNNQVGFTTDPIDARSTHYASDPAKGFDVPVLHVADDADACIAAVRLAVAYRDQFAQDVVIDVVGYRRYGHNETDEPAFTQPKLYELVKEHPTPRQVWGARLLAEGIATDEQVAAIDKEFADKITADYHEMKAAPGGGHQASSRLPTPAASDPATAVRGDTLESINTRLLECAGLQGASAPGQDARAPARRAPQRRHRLGTRRGAVRRAAARRDQRAAQRTGRRARDVRPPPRRGARRGDRGGAHAARGAAAGRGWFEIYNSPLSETAVMGFEYGFATARAARHGAVGGAVRRLRQRRAADHRPVHLVRPREVGAAERVGAAASTRLRGRWPRALEREPRTVPPALRRAEHGGGVSVDAGLYCHMRRLRADRPP